MLSKWLCHAFDLRFGWTRLYSSDNDDFGLVFGYQDIDNYFRVLFRQQTSGSLGGTQGTSVQKVVAGVATQISPNGTAPGNIARAPTLAMINSHAPFDVEVVVDGSNYAVYVAGGLRWNPLQSGSDARYYRERSVSNRGHKTWTTIRDSARITRIGEQRPNDFCVGRIWNSV